MGMSVSASNVVKKTIEIKKPNGSSAGRITITSSKPKKKKKLFYNLKRISNQILMSKTSNTASKTVASARTVVVSLLRKKSTGDYDDNELNHAIIHAKKMERVARKRMKHMREEERAAKGGACLAEDGETREQEVENAEAAGEESPQIDTQRLEEMMRELEELMKETMEDAMEASLQEMAQEMMGSVAHNLEPEELEQLKKKHRSDELQEIMRADMEYLKALFNKLAREKQAAANGSSGNTGSAESAGQSPGAAPYSGGRSSGVSLELMGKAMAVDAVDMPVLTEGANMDISV